MMLSQYKVWLCNYVTLPAKVSQSLSKYIKGECVLMNFYIPKLGSLDSYIC